MPLKRLVAFLFLAGIVVACTGIPLRSMPQLMKLQDALLEAHPAEFMVAIQADARMAPPPGAAPTFQLAIRPREPGGFDAVERTLPMRLITAPANTLGLAAAPANRRWFIYSFPPESQTELLRIQSYFKRIKAEQRGKGGGSLSVGIAQKGVAARDPALADTRWESWLQMSKQDGFFELWSGSIGDLLRQAENEAEKAPPRKPN
jgi:hypothetical protein